MLSYIHIYLSYKTNEEVPGRSQTLRNRRACSVMQMTFLCDLVLPLPYTTIPYEAEVIYSS